MRIIKIERGIVVEVKLVSEGYILGEDEIKTELGELGQILQQDGTFIDPEPIPIEPKPNLEERFDQIQQDNIILMDALATTFEEILNLQTQVADLQGGTV